MKFLLTGAAGFIGSHLSKKLLDEGHSVIGFDNLSSGDIRNIVEFLDNPNFNFIEGDVTEPFSFEVDYILNFACPASPVQYQRNPVETVKTNVLGMMHSLELAKAKKIPVLQASTSEVYGDPLEHPQLETYFGNVNPIGVRACYDEGKRIAETLCFDYARQYGVQVRIFRIFNTYGPKMRFDDGRVVSNFISQALKNKVITLYGNGQQTRSFCYVDDLVQAVMKFIESPNQLSGPYNIGNPAENTVKELAELVLKLTKSKSEITILDLPGDDPKKRKPNIDKFRNEYDWYPQVGLEEGLRRTINDFETRFGLSFTESNVIPF